MVRIKSTAGFLIRINSVDQNHWIRCALRRKRFRTNLFIIISRKSIVTVFAPDEFQQKMNKNRKFVITRSLVPVKTSNVMSISLRDQVVLILDLSLILKFYLLGRIMKDYVQKVKFKSIEFVRSSVFEPKPTFLDFSTTPLDHW